jgi:tRNA modification GTPase
MTDTIVAQATAPGRGGIGILRISGPQATHVARAIVGHCPKPRYADYRRFYDDHGDVIDQGIVLFFPQPHSFTGEDVLELQGHGGAAVLDLLLQRVLQLPGLRLAKPGEFSERAFMNHKLDLAQAEAIADLIDASSQQAARAAMRSLQGLFSQQVQLCLDSLIRLRVQVEAAIDFPDEGVDVRADEAIATELVAILSALEQLQASAQQGALLREGLQVVLAGHPNAGKSSLMNALTGDQTAIVTAIPGTTRDVLRRLIQIDGIPLHLVDTAGLHESTDEIECLGIERAWSAIKQADHLLLVIDSTQNTVGDSPFLATDLLQQLPTTIPMTVIYNKVDLTQEAVGLSEVQGYPLLRLSAQTGAGLEQLRQHLKTVLGWQNAPEGGFLARRRHLTALEQTLSHLQQGEAQLLTQGANELLAESLRLAQQSLGLITGRFTSEELLGEIFSQFCIGK